MGCWAWNRRGQACDPLAPEAWRWNARGAIYAESGVRPTDPKVTRSGTLYGFLDDAAEAVFAEHGLHIPIGWEKAENLGHALTLRALEAAAKLAEEMAPVGTAC